MGTNISDYRAQGAVIIERLRTTKTPAALAPHIKCFRGAHDGYEAAAVRVDAASAKRADALEAIGAADTALDAAIDALADKLDRRVKKHKEKLSDHHATDAQKPRPS